MDRQYGCVGTRGKRRKKYMVCLIGVAGNVDEDDARRVAGCYRRRRPWLSGGASAGTSLTPPVHERAEPTGGFFVDVAMRVWRQEFWVHGENVTRNRWWGWNSSTGCCECGGVAELRVLGVAAASAASRAGAPAVAAIRHDGFVVCMRRRRLQRRHGGWTNAEAGELEAPERILRNGEYAVATHAIERFVKPIIFAPPVILGRIVLHCVFGCQTKDTESACDDRGMRIVGRGTAPPESIERPAQYTSY
jgi:hypothetical protein